MKDPHSVARRLVEITEAMLKAIQEDRMDDLEAYTRDRESDFESLRAAAGQERLPEAVREEVKRIVELDLQVLAAARAKQRALARGRESVARTREASRHFTPRPATARFIQRRV
ncbi:MAG: hypothetical protein MJE66_08780 [Proteobacteria bacterium]|nr:hypothetical protein [Pseudomonadota bacterium]